MGKMVHVPPKEGYFTGGCPSAKPALWDGVFLTRHPLIAFLKCYYVVFFIIIIIIVYSPFSMLARVGLLPPRLLVVSCTTRNHF